VRIGLWGNFGTGNLGNECTLQAVVHNARRHSPGAELVCICSGPADSARRHGVAVLPISSRRSAAIAVRGATAPARAGLRLTRVWQGLRDWYRPFTIMRDVDRLVMCGTGMLSDAGEGFRGLPYEMFRWSLAAKLSGRELMFASVGAESMLHPLTRAFVKTALRLADFRSYRDVQSRACLEGIGLDVRNDAVYPDLAFSLPETLFRSPGRVTPGRRVVAVGLYDYCGRGEVGGDKTAYRCYLEKMGGLVVRLLEEGFAVRIVIGDPPYDEPVRCDLRAALEARGVVLDPDRFGDEPTASVEQLVEQLAQADLVVATRFHSVLLALMLGKPVVSVAYNAKNDALMDALGLRRYCQAIDAFDVEGLVGLLREIEAGGTPFGDVCGRTAGYREELNRLYGRIFGAGTPSPPTA
jgi:polysaccharide pyruvyl transferase WcaK-like protein